MTAEQINYRAQIQGEARAGLAASLAEGNRGPILLAATGFGKTHTAAAEIAERVAAGGSRGAGDRSRRAAQISLHRVKRWPERPRPVPVAQQPPQQINAVPAAACAVLPAAVRAEPLAIPVIGVPSKPRGPRVTG